MSISIEGNVRCFENMQYRSKVKGKKAGVAAADINRDHVFIGSGALQVKEKSFAEEAVGNVLLDIRRTTSQDKIETLKQQVADGTYHPDAEQIAACMLLERGIMPGE